MHFTWTAPADDGLSASSGPAQEFDLRYSLSNITNDYEWWAANQACEPIPGVVGTGHGIDFSGLASCTDYYFVLRTWDDKPQLSGLHTALKVKTFCGGGGGGSMRTSRGSAAIGRDRVGASPGLTSLGAAASGVLTAETFHDAATDEWRLVLTSSVSPEGVASEEAGAALVQVRENDAWRTMVQPATSWSDERAAIPVFRDGRRILFPAGFQLAGVAKVASVGQERFVAVEAVSNQRGALDMSTGLSNLTLATDESVVLRYAHVESSEAADEYLLTASRASTLSRLERERPKSEPTAGSSFAFRLQGVHPNPVVGDARLQFELPHATATRLEIFDLLGRRVQTLSEGILEAGPHEILWNRRDANGRALAAGVYVARLTTPENRAEIKFVLVP